MLKWILASIFIVTLSGCDRCECDTCELECCPAANPNLVKARHEVASVEKETDKNPPQPVAESPIQSFDLSSFDKAIKVGHGKWTVTENTLNVHSTSYGFAGMFIMDVDNDNATIEAVLHSGKVGPSAYQGLALCVSKENGEYHGAPCVVARLLDGKIQIVDCVSNFKNKWQSEIASVPVSRQTTTDYTLKLTVKNGKSLEVSLDGKSVLTHTLNRNLHGAWALVAANGSFSFKNVRFGATEKK